MSLKNKTLFVTGASRGIGLAIALRAARDGANIIVAAKTDQPHPKLPGTIHTAAAEIEAAGGKALPLMVDVRDEDSVAAAVAAGVEAFGGIDICINNASAISLTGALDTEMKRYDLMHQVNGRGTFLVSKACLPHLLKAENPHVLALSPPLDLSPRWFGPHVAYTVAKYNMSLFMLGLAEEFKGRVAFNGLWPRTTIATSAVKYALGGDAMMNASRSPEILADAAHAIFEKDARTFSGRFLIDDTFLYDEGVRDFEPYRMVPGSTLLPDFFVPADSPPPPGVKL